MYNSYKWLGIISLKIKETLHVFTIFSIGNKKKNPFKMIQNKPLRYLVVLFHKRAITEVQ